MRKDESAICQRQKTFDQQRYIFPALPERRQGETDDVEAVKQVFAKAARRHFTLQIPVRGRHQANVDLDPLQGTERADFLFLKHAEQLDLEFQGKLADFVEEGRAAIGEFDQPSFGVDRARECAPHVAE